MIKEPKRKSVPTQKTVAFKEELRIGGELAAVLPQMMSQSQVAKSLGISQQMVSRLERRALFKLRHAMLNRLGLTGAEIADREYSSAKTEVVTPDDESVYSGND